MPHYDAKFYGYREFVLKLGGIRPMPPRPPDPPPNRLKWWEWDLLGPIPYDYKFFNGIAGDAYPADFTEIGWNTRMMYGLVRQHPAIFQFRYKTGMEPDEREFDIGFIRLESVTGFKIRNARQGLDASYTIGFLR